MYDESVLIEALGNSPKLRVLDFLIDNMRFDYSKKEIMEGAQIGKTTLFKIWNESLKLGIIRPTRRFGKAQLFTLNENNEVVKQLLRLEFVLGNRAMQKAVEKNKIALQAKRK